MRTLSKTLLLSVIQVAGLCLLSPAADVRHSDLPDPGFAFRTFFVTWGGTDRPEFTKFLKAARPEIVQAGFYGPMFHGYADNPQSIGYPMQLPVAGQHKALDAWRKMNAEIHELGLKVVGHFQMVNVIAHPVKKDGFLKFYEERWPEELLGKKPHEDVAELLQRDAKGNILTRKHYVDYVGLCSSSPHARQMLKQMLKVAVDAGIDGVMVNYNYHWSCVCPYCQASFRKYLAKRHPSEILRTRFGINDLPAHTFAKIAAEIPGYPAKTASALDWEAMRWGALSFKQAFDEIFIKYGRSLRSDLIVATWNHIGNMGITEERMFTPGRLWGKEENYFWYSGGYGPTKLKERKAGDGWLNCLYIREMSGGKPFMLGKYEAIRMRNSIAEGLATGGSGMGLYMNIKDPVAFEMGVKYLQFAHRNDELYRPREPYAEVALLYPRQSILGGNRESMDVFRAAGRVLIDNHFLTDVVADEKLTRERLGKYKVLVLPRASRLEARQCTMIEQYAAEGGRLLALGETALTMPDGKSLSLPAADVQETAAAVKRLAGDSLSSFDAPWMLRVSAYREPGKLVLHFVNYSRDEERGKKLNSPSAECPLAVKDIGVRLSLMPGRKVGAVRLLSPDEPGEKHLPHRLAGAYLEFRVPQVLVYTVTEISFTDKE